MLKLQSLLLVIATFLLIIILNLGISEQELVNAQTSEALHQQAKSLTQSGQEALERGDTITALKEWQEATKIYRQVKYQEGIAGSLINQSLALQKEGFNLKACSTLLESLNLNTDWLCNSALTQTPSDPKQALSVAITKLVPSQINALGLQKLGDVLWAIGKTDESETVLLKALEVPKTTKFASNIDNVKLSLGNVQRAIFNQLQDRYSSIGDPSMQQSYLFSIQEAIDSSVQYYQQVERPDVSKPVELSTYLNHLALLIDADKFFAQVRVDKDYLTNYYDQIHAQIHPLALKIQQSHSDFEELPKSESILAQLNYATSLNYLGNKLLAIEHTKFALQLAQSLNSPRLQSNCYGILAGLIDNNEKSQGYLEAALNLADSVQARDLAWQWQHQLGQVYQKRGEYTKAVQAYNKAIDNLGLVRNNLLSVTPDIQYSFRDRVEPVYREYIRLLLSNSRPDLEQVVKVNENLQLAELENYLQCNQLDLVSFSQLKGIRPPAIHLIDLGDTVEVIVESSDRSRSLHRHQPNSKLVKDNLFFLLNNLQDPGFAYSEVDSSILPFARVLYQQIIEPIKTYLPSSGTLVFIPDSSFQNLPFGILHDGQDYLLQQYSIDLTLNSQIRQPKALSRNQLKALVAGLAAKHPPSFSSSNVPKNLSPLPETLTEIANVRKFVSSSVLLDRNFTTSHLQQDISDDQYPIVHISTHGRFSSDPNLTYILDWNQVLNLKQLNALLRNRSNQEALELFVLSACQTAAGDNRSALGIAGVAVQAGARSTVASLWLVNTDSTALLMGNFYEGLKMGLSKAEALRQAQLFLLKNPKYSHPYYWSNFVLVGSWL